MQKREEHSGEKQPYTDLTTVLCINDFAEEHRDGKWNTAIAEREVPAASPPDS